MDVNEWKALPQWVCWNAEPAKNGGKPRKVPKNPSTGLNAKFNDHSTWATACEAWAAKNKYRFNGITFVMSAESGVVGVDLDDCFEDTDGRRHLKTYAKNIALFLNSRTEYSPSGSGLHIFCVGQIPSNIHRPMEGFEMYGDKHGLTVTGKLLDAPKFGLPELPVSLEDRTEELYSLYVQYAPPPREKRVRPSVGSGLNGSVEEGDIRNLLSYVPKRMDYYDWVRVLMSVYSAFPNDTGVSLIEEWSPGEDGEVAEKFRSFASLRDGPSLGTLYHYAKANGYRGNK